MNPFDPFLPVRLWWLQQAHLCMAIALTGTGLSSPTEPASRLRPAGFDPISRRRHLKLVVSNG